MKTRTRTSSDNPVAIANRIKKAYRIADWIQREAGPLLDTEFDGPAILAGMGEEWWNDAAKQAGCRKPSDKTINLVISVIKARMDGGDPFEGFEGP